MVCCSQTLARQGRQLAPTSRVRNKPLTGAVDPRGDLPGAGDLIGRRRGYSVALQPPRGLAQLGGRFAQGWPYLKFKMAHGDQPCCISSHLEKSPNPGRDALEHAAPSVRDKWIRNRRAECHSEPEKRQLKGASANASRRVAQTTISLDLCKYLRAYLLFVRRPPLR